MRCLANYSLTRLTRLHDRDVGHPARIAPSKAQHVTTIIVNESDFKGIANEAPRFRSRSPGQRACTIG
ncbi:MAG: hypothetical protein ACRENH_07875, partial [Gemmatimonadaceae bacterium]